MTAAAPAQTTVARPSPYQGLVPYSEADAEWFFGREEWSAVVADNLRAYRATVLYGASGVGKSSLLHAGMITASTLAAFAWAVRWFPDHASTVALMTLAFAQILHLGTARSDRDVLVPARALRNRFALAAVVISVALQLATLTDGLSRVLNVTMVPPVAWLAIVAGAAAPAILGQALKVLGHHTRSFAQTVPNS